MFELSERKILVVDDHEVIRAALTTSLVNHGWGDITQADSLQGALHLISSQPFTDVLTDHHLPDGEGLELAPAALKRNPEITLALFTFDESWMLVERARALGFSLFISKQSSITTIMESLHKISNATQSFAIHAPSLPRKEAIVSPLTRSEIEVLSFFSQGLTTSEIAIKRHNSEATIKTHVGAILRKLESRNRIEAIAKARDLRLIPIT
jgi:DNA-binding NarL/FixJ family response regulator